jgi:hypothetical protein
MRESEREYFFLTLIAAYHLIHLYIHNLYNIYMFIFSAYHYQKKNICSYLVVYIIYTPGHDVACGSIINLFFLSSFLLTN